MSFLCGIFVPQQLLGDNLLSVSMFLPLYWYIKNHNMIFGYSDESFLQETFWKYAGIQLLFIAALFSIALVTSKLKRTR
jgi:ABC-2 type transport system permease protein